MSEENMGGGSRITRPNEITQRLFILMTTSQEENWFFRIVMQLSSRSPVYSLGFPAITNLCMQSQTFFLENDTLCQCGLQWIQQKLCKFELFNLFRKRGRPLAV